MEAAIATNFSLDTSAVAIEKGLQKWEHECIKPFNYSGCIRLTTLTGAADDVRLIKVSILRVGIS